MRKPFNIITWLASKAVSEQDNAGFFFYQTQDGYQFKSIDKLFDKQQKKSYVFNNSTDAKEGIPAGYDGKILQHQADSSINVQSKMNMGAYKTKLVMFDPYNCKYVVNEKTADEAVEKKKVKLAGKGLPVFNEKFKTPTKDFTRTTFMTVSYTHLTLPTKRIV